MPNPKLFNQTIPANTVTRLQLPTGVSLGGGITFLQVFNTSTANDLYFCDQVSSQADAPVLTTSSTNSNLLPPRFSKVVEINSATAYWFFCTSNTRVDFTLSGSNNS